MSITFDNDNGNDITLTYTKSTKQDDERSKREDCMIKEVYCMTCKGCKNELLYLQKDAKQVTCKCGTLNTMET